MLAHVFFSLCSVYSFDYVFLFLRVIVDPAVSCNAFDEVFFPRTEQGVSEYNVYYLAVVTTANFIDGMFHGFYPVFRVTSTCSSRPWFGFRSAGSRRMSGNVLFVRPVVGLFAGLRAETVSTDGFLCIIGISAPSAMFFCSKGMVLHGVTPKSGRLMIVFPVQQLADYCSNADMFGFVKGFLFYSKRSMPCCSGVTLTRLHFRLSKVFLFLWWTTIPSGQFMISRCIRLQRLCPFTNARRRA